MLLRLGELDIGDMAAIRAVEVTMLTEVRAESCRLAIDVDGLHQTIAHHRLEAVVDGGQGDGWHLLLGSDEDLCGRGMIPLSHQHLVDLTTLRRESESPLNHCRGIGSGCALAGRNGGVFLHQVVEKRNTRNSSIKNYSK